ncbi:MAG: methyltransferase domain-containing protein [Candidatus Hydrogenedentes bacterium]|nr:methyltransferase domain-containing protein [Candidatus Hydrogenedentota bacterium]
MSPIEAPDTICHHPERARNLSLEYILDFVPPSAARILDCTGTWGQRGHRIKSRGAREVIGLVDATAGTPGPHEGYDEVVQGPLDFVQLPRQRFDCMICGDALERLRNPEAFLPPLLKLLAPGGLFLAAVPNMQYHKIVCALAEGRWDYGERGVWSRDNLRFYTAHELRWLMNRAGVAQCKLASLVADAPGDFPRDEAGYARAGRLRIGPLGDDAYAAWLIEYYLLLAVKPA